MKQLNVLELPLNEKVLIEASAGTGKTYTIGLIVLRLLLEKNITIEKIVMITFTEAAMADLRKKTSEKLLEAYDIWKNGSAEDNDLTAIIKRAKKENAKIKEAALLDAIARLDEIPIYTIHGFCKRLLSEFSFETGNFEEREVVTDTSEIQDRVIADFWRKNIKNLNEKVELSPDDLKKSINAVLNHPGVIIEGEDYELSLNDLKNSVKGAEKKFKYAIAYKLSKEIHQKLSLEKKRLKIMDFDDMIENCHKAIIRDKNKILKNAVNTRYKAILVDEFQDTDKIQFEIFDYLFKGKPFFMIGDPKQAVYRFRGGDIFAYKEARESAGLNQFSMNKNYRSEKNILHALNTFFDNCAFKGAMGEGIDYRKIECGKTDLIPFNETDNKYPPFVIWEGKADDDEQKGDFKKKVQNAVISEIKRLLCTGRIKLKDIAILLDSNKDCLDYKNKLAKENIISIVKGRSVFSSVTANFLNILLNAICFNSNIRFVMALLTHCGFQPKNINDKLITEWASTLHKAKINWTRYGIMYSIEYFMSKQNLWAYISANPNGSGNIANIRQLIQLLCMEEVKYGKVPEKIYKRFASLCLNKKPSGYADEDSEERPGTDDDAIKIMTIHKAKGLEFNIVFVPDISRYTHDHRFPNVYMYHENNEKIISYHAENKEASKLHNIEENEEAARLLYVALTRAKYRLYTAYSPCKKNKDGSISQKYYSICREIFENFSRQNIQGGNILIEPLEQVYGNDYSFNKIKTNASPEKTAEKLPDNFIVKPAWENTSFTGIQQFLQKEEYKTAYNKDNIIPLEYKIPAGKRMGTLLHDIFENLDFNATENDIQNMVNNKLDGFNEFSSDTPEGSYRKAWVENQVKIILKKQLPGEAGSLCDINAGNRISELNFFMSTENIDLQELSSILKEKIKGFEIDCLPSDYIKGALDLVFLGNDNKYYILDWKSNSLDDFSNNGMEEAMRRHGYHLQYLIYAVALKRWLELTHVNFNFKENFGGVYYIFIRGITEEDGANGIYFSAAEDILESIEEADKLFGGNN